MNSISGQDKVADLLIEKGADVNAKLKTNWTALHMASENGKILLITRALNTANLLTSIRRAFGNCEIIDQQRRQSRYQDYSRMDST